MKIERCVSGERRTPKMNFLCSQMGFEPTTVRTLVGCCNHWATGDSSGERQSMWAIWHNYRIAQVTLCQWTHIKLHSCLQRTRFYWSAPRIETWLTGPIFFLAFAKCTFCILSQSDLSDLTMSLWNPKWRWLCQSVSCFRFNTYNVSSTWTFWKYICKS